MKNIERVLSHPLIPDAERKQLGWITPINNEGSAIQNYSLARTNIHFVQFALQVDPCAIMFVDPKLITHDLCLRAVSIKGAAFKFLPRAFQSELDIIVRALQNQGGFNNILSYINFAPIESLLKQKPIKDDVLFPIRIRNFDLMCELLAVEVKNLKDLPSWLRPHVENKKKQIPTDSAVLSKGKGIQTNLNGVDLNNIKQLVYLCVQNIENLAIILEAKDYKLNKDEADELLRSYLPKLYSHDFSQYRKVVIALLEENGLYLQYITKQDLYFAWTAILQNPLSFQYVIESLKIPAIQYMALALNPSTFRFCTKEFVDSLKDRVKKDPEFHSLIERIDVLFANLLGAFGKEISEYFSSYPFDEAMLKLVFSQGKGKPLEFFAAKPPKNGICDVNFAGWNFTVSEATVKVVVLNALKAGFSPPPSSRKNITVYIPNHLLNDIDILTVLMAKYPQTLRNTKLNIDVYEKIMGTIFSENPGQALAPFAADKPKKGVCSASFRDTPIQLSEHCVKRLVLSAINSFIPLQGELRAYVPSYLLDDIEIQKCLAMREPKYFKDYKNIQADVAVVKAVIQRDIPQLPQLQYVHSSLKLNKELAKIAIQQNPNAAYAFFDKSLWGNIEFMASVKQFLSLEQYATYVPDEDRRNDIEVYIIREEQVRPAQLFLQEKNELLNCRYSAKKLKEKLQSYTESYNALVTAIKGSSVFSESQKNRAMRFESYDDAREFFNKWHSVQETYVDPVGGSPVREMTENERLVAFNSRQQQMTNFAQHLSSGMSLWAEPEARNPQTFPQTQPEVRIVEESSLGERIVEEPPLSPAQNGENQREVVRGSRNRQSGGGLRPSPQRRSEELKPPTPKRKLVERAEEDPNKEKKTEQPEQTRRSPSPPR